MAVNERYREISYTRRNGDDAGFEADTELVFRNGKAFRRIRSQTVRTYIVDVPCAGDPVAYERRLMVEKREMSRFDDRNRKQRGYPKPATAPRAEPCPGCGGEGEYEDKHGNWKTCKMCGGEG